MFYLINKTQNHKLQVILPPFLSGMCWGSLMHAVLELWAISISPKSFNNCWSSVCVAGGGEI